VVLIDEVDKAPRDFPNDILRELETFGFEIAELGGAALTAPSAMLPIVVITSNAERALPDAFLRRCAYHHMAFPDAETLERIVYARVSQIKSPAKIVADAVAIVTRLRSVGLHKLPGTAELLAFVLALRASGFGPDTDLTQSLIWLPTALTTLVKAGQDLEAARQALAAVDGQPRVQSGSGER
jgi:MoxR-like ATPase